MTAAATIYTLILVTTGADVKHSDWPTLHACQEAKSMALFGMTIEVKKAADEAEVAREKKAQEEAQAARLKKYPPREATAAEIAEARKFDGELPSAEVCNEVAFPVKTGFVIPGAPVCWGVSTSSSYIESAPQGVEIRAAECVIEAEPRP